MKTNQIMESVESRTLNGVVVRQRTKDGFFALKDLVLVCDKFCYEHNRPRFDVNQYFRLDSTKAFINALEKKKEMQVIYKQTKSSLGWIHPHIFLDILLWANPEFKVEVYDWLWDYLIKNRIDSGNSYNQMVGALWNFTSNKSLFKKAIANLANRIKDLIGVDDWNKASEAQLKERDDLQRFIADLTETLRDAKQGVNIAFRNYERKKLQNKGGLND